MCLYIRPTVQEALESSSTDLWQKSRPHNYNAGNGKTRAYWTCGHRSSTWARRPHHENRTVWLADRMPIAAKTPGQYWQKIENCQCPLFWSHSLPTHYLPRHFCIAVGNFVAVTLLGRMSFYVHTGHDALNSILHSRDWTSVGVQWQLCFIWFQLQAIY